MSRRSFATASWSRSEMRASAICVAVLAASLAACSSEPAVEIGGPWVGTITTEGNVTTVFNESGSVWGGTATLVEEASIGVDQGADEYMLGFVGSVYGSDEHIYVVDRQTKLVRRYDHDGVYVGTVGGIGQGPGEYLDPTAVAVAPDGRILVLDGQAGRTQVYSADGATLDTWSTLGAACCAWPLRFDADGFPWFPTRKRHPDTFELINGVRAFGPDGPVGENIPLFASEVPEVSVSVGGRRISLQFGPRLSWTPAGRASILSGIGDEYRFQLEQDGKVILRVEKYWEPLPVDPAHTEWQRRLIVARGRRFEPGWNWNGSELPEHHPAYFSLISTSGGGFWVSRAGKPQRLTDCVDDPLAAADGGRAAASNGCWRYVWILDAFDKDGKFLGEIDTPLNLMPSPLFTHVDEDRVIGVEVDDLGTFRVKRYRLVLPGEE